MLEVEVALLVSSVSEPAFETYHGIWNTWRCNQTRHTFIIGVVRFAREKEAHGTGIETGCHLDWQWRHIQFKMLLYSYPSNWVCSMFCLKIDGWKVAKQEEKKQPGGLNLQRSLTRTCLEEMFWGTRTSYHSKYSKSNNQKSYYSHTKLIPKLPVKHI